jgi:hypothetical protein
MLIEATNCTTVAGIIFHVVQPYFFLYEVTYQAFRSIQPDIFLSWMIGLFCMWQLQIFKLKYTMLLYIFDEGATQGNVKSEVISFHMSKFVVVMNYRQDKFF